MACSLFYGMEPLRTSSKAYYGERLGERIGKGLDTKGMEDFACGFIKGIENSVGRLGIKDVREHGKENAAAASHEAFGNSKHLGNQPGGIGTKDLREGMEKHGKEYAKGMENASQKIAGGMIEIGNRMIVCTAIASWVTWIVGLAVFNNKK